MQAVTHQNHHLWRLPVSYHHFNVSIFSVYDDEDGVGMGGGVDGVDIVDCDANCV